MCITRIENLRRRIEGQLYIPGYVSERVRNCINDLGWSSYTDDCINDAWRELKRIYAGGGNAATIYRKERYVIAYLRYYFFLIYPAIKWILFKILERGAEIIPRERKRNEINILDYGAGPGTASMAICDFLKGAKESSVYVYENKAIKLHFDELSGLFSKCYKNMLGGHEMVREIIDNMRDESDGGQNRYDIIVASYVLNELSDGMRELFLDKARRYLTDGGYLIIIESAYANARRYMGDFLNLTRGSFKIIDASGPLCSLQSCRLRDKCSKISIKRKDLRIPDGMTEEMRRSFSERNGGKTKWVHAILRKEENIFVDPSRVEEHRGSGSFTSSGWVIERNLTERAENITLCHGLGPCNLAFWRERKVFEQVGDVSEGDILWIEGDYSGSSFNDLHSVYVSRIIEHIKK